MRKPLELAYSLFLPQGLKRLHESLSPFLITHCVLGCRKTWDGAAQIIANETGKRVYTVDLCNHGESPRTDQGSFLDMASDVSNLMQRQGITKCDLIGHSLGGRVSMVLALQQPAYVRTLAVVDVSPMQEPAQMGRYIDSWIHAMRRAVKELPEQISFEAGKKEIEKKLLSNDLMDPSFCEILLDTLIYKDNGFHWLSDLDFLEAHFDSHVRPFPDVKQLMYAGPTYFIGSGKPVFLKLRDHPGIYHLFPKAEIVYIPGSGHHVFLDKPVEFLKTIIDFHRRFKYIS